MDFAFNYSAGHAEDARMTEKQFDIMNHKLCEGNRESGGYTTRPASTLSERIAPLDIDINDVDVDNPGAGVYADLYRKCPPIPWDTTRHRHQTTCLVHGDPAHRQGNPHSPRDGCFRRSAANSSQSQSLLPPPLDPHHDDGCARHRRGADDVFSKGDGGSSFLPTEQDAKWCGDQRMSGDRAGCHVCPTKSPSTHAVSNYYRNQTTGDSGYKNSAREESVYATEQKYHDIAAIPSFQPRVYEETNGAFGTDQVAQWNEIPHARQTPDCGHASRVALPQQRDDINGNSIRGSYHDFDAALNYSIGNSFSGRPPVDVNTFNTNTSCYDPMIAAGSFESRNPSSNCPHNLKVCASNSDWRHSMGDASSVTGEVARQAQDAGVGLRTGQCMVDETSFGTGKRDTDRQFIRRSRRRRERVNHVIEHEDIAARAVPSDASMTSRSTSDSTDLTWLNRLAKRPTSPPLHSPPESDIAGLAPYQPPQPATCELQSDEIVTLDQKLYTDNDMCDEVAELSTSPEDGENIFTNSRGTATSCDYTTPSVAMPKVATSRRTSDDRVDVVTVVAPKTPTAAVGDITTRMPCRLDATESNAGRRMPLTVGECVEPTPRDFWGDDIILHDIGDILIGSEFGDDGDVLERAVDETGGGSEGSPPASGVSVEADVKRLIQQHATKTNLFLHEMYKDGRLTDVIVEAEEREFKVHSVVLACHSQFFRQRLETASPPNRIACETCVSATAFKSILDYLYTGKLDLTTPLVTEVWRAASELRLPAVEKQCWRMVGELDAAGALVVLEDAARLDLNDVCQSMIQTIGQDFSKASSSTKMLSLPVDLLCGVLSSTQLIVASELDVLRSAMRWLQHDREARTGHVRRVIECVRFSLMTSTELFAAAKLVDGYLDDPEISNMLMKANWYRTSVQLNSPNRIRSCVAVRRGVHSSSVVKDNGDFHSIMTSNHGDNLFSSGNASQMEEPRATRSTTHNDTVFKRQVLFVFGACRLLGKGTGISASATEQVVYRYVARNMSWRQVSKLPQCRTHYSVCASNGYIYVTGGGITSDISEDKIVPTKTVLRWSPESSTWSQVAPLFRSRMQHCSVGVGDRIYVIGGCQSSRSFLSSVECFSGAWKEVTQLHFRRMGACAVSHRNGILVAGGYGGEDGETPVVLDVVEFIDLDTLGCTEFVSLRIPRCCAAMTSLQDKVYICGGLTTSDARTHCALSSVDIYDDRRAIWTKFTELSRSRYNAAFVTLGTKLCVIGGRTPVDDTLLSQVECYDLLSASWTDVLQELPASISEPKAVILRY